MAVKNYKKSDNTRLSGNFRVSEFACHGCGCCDTVLVDEQLVEYLQKIRDHFAAAVTITSGYRCEKRNASVGGVKSSLHCKGMAADIMVKGIAPAEVARFSESIGILGIGLYETEKDGYFVHIDTRQKKGFWYGQAQAYRSGFGGEKACAVMLKELKMGSRGEPVRALQRLLIGAGCDCGSYGADGSFGSDTDQAVREYQNANGLDTDGIAGTETWSKLLGVS